VGEAAEICSDAAESIRNQANRLYDKDRLSILSSNQWWYSSLQM